MRKNWTKIAIALGPITIIASLAWEYARVNKDYNFIVEPWALRGFETNHFPVFLAAATLLLIVGVATAWEGALKPAVSVGITLGLVAGATVFAFAFRSESITISMGIGFIIALSVILGLVIGIALRSALGSSNAAFKRASLNFLVAFVVVFGLLFFTMNGSEVELPTGVVVLVVGLVIAGLSLAIQPITMAANRMLIYATVAMWGLILFSAGALRENLLAEQMMTVQGNGVVGISVQYKDTQAATGWWLAGFAATVAFVGAVGLWAKRRDIVAALARARKQREAAEISAREIEEAAEQYRRELEARKASSS